MVLPPGCTMCVGSGVMCRVKRGSLRSGGPLLRQVQEPKRKRKQKQMADDSVFSSGIMIRIDKTEVIEKQYNEGYLRFSCPANWINYAKIQPPGIADKYEAVFAHVKRDDPRL